MTPWQRRLRAAIAVFGVAFATFVYVTVRQPAAPVRRETPPPRADPAAALEIATGVLQQLRGTREGFRVHYDQNFVYDDGRQRFVGARVAISKRGGRDFTIASREAEVSATQEDVRFRDHVTLEASDGLVVHAPEARYSKAEETVRADGAVDFRRNRLTGTSVGMTYDQGRDVLQLLDRAMLRLEPEQADGAAVDIQAGAVVFARPDHYMRFDRGFTLVHEGRTFQSDLATAYLSDDDARVEILEMRGHARVMGMGDAPGTLRAMSAQDINLEFAADGRTLARATLSNDAAIDVAGAGAASRRITGAWIDVPFAPDGSTATSLVAREVQRPVAAPTPGPRGVALDLPQDGDQPARTITAASLVATGAPGQGITSATFVEDVAYRELRPALAGGSPAPARVARARKLVLSVQPGFGAVDDARFSGAVRFEEGTVRAAAAEARYRVKQGVLELEGADESTGQMPRVADEFVTVQGQRVALTMEGRKIVATGSVTCVMQPVREAAAGTPGTATVKRAAMLNAALLVTAMATSLTYDGATRLAVYEGGARLWQGDTAIQGDRLTIDDGTGNMTVTGKARSTLLLDQRDAATGEVSRVPTIATAEEFRYEESARRATYTTKAHVAGPQGDLRGTKVELYLKVSGSELDRVEAYTTVTVEAAGREASGDRLTYFADEGRYLMAGSPVRIVADCRETAGRVLTFYKSVDTIIVDGKLETQTQTKGVAKCGAPRIK
jgi:lipopolysaccharide export system protein LptA